MKYSEHDSFTGAALISKAIAILEYLASSNDDSSPLSSIAEETGINKTTTYRILQSLKKHAYVQQSPRTGFYGLGTGLLVFSRYVNSFDIANSVLPYMREYSEKTCLSTGLAILEDNMSVIIEAYSPSNSSAISLSPQKGFHTPLSVCASGKIFLSQMSDSILNNYLDSIGTLPKVAPNSISDPSVLRNELESIRQQGYSLEFEEFEPHLACAGAPIYSYDGDILCVITNMMLAESTSIQELNRIGYELKNFADNISAEISGKQIRTV